MHRHLKDGRQDLGRGRASIPCPGPCVRVEPKGDPPEEWKMSLSRGRTLRVEDMTIGTSPESAWQTLSASSFDAP